MKINSENNNAAVLSELGARIKRNRIDMQLSQQDFAAKAGISTRTLSAAENGEDIRLSNLIRILRTLGCLENFDTLLPALAFDPESYRTLGRERKRVSRTGENKDTSEWKWGDEE
ncbi:MAG: helix-turn-helix domain-containing protein [Clostridia bacterium]|nr:helix-turn-helix domain-containing protein [Clostridia bacterium]